jgi:Gpi18-like mannosyltransferase
MEYDMGFWRQWALEIHRNGLPSAYNSSINYFPVYLYGLYFYDLLQGTEANIAANINNIKMLFVLFDFLPLVVLCAFRQRLLQYKIPYLYLLLNVAYVFTSLVWGQIDSIYTSLAFLAIVVALQYPAAGTLLYLLALNTKPQSIVFAPVIGAILLYRVRAWKTVFTTIALCAVAQLALLIPFLFNGGVRKLVYHAVHSVDLYNKLSISAFNIWYLIQPGNPYFINDKDTFFLLSYKSIGLLLFSISALLIFWPVVTHLWKLRRASIEPNQHTHQLIMLGTGMLCLCFFYFNSQMHERYAHPIIIFFFFYSVVSGNYRLYILASIPYFLSLDKAFSFPNGYLPIVHYKFLFASKVIALWYTATITYGGYLFWSLCRKEPLATIQQDT